MNDPIVRIAVSVTVFLAATGWLTWAGIRSFSARLARRPVGRGRLILEIVLCVGAVAWAIAALLKSFEGIQ